MKLVVFLFVCTVVSSEIDVWSNIFRENFSQMDKNSDGLVEMSEYSQMFLAADVNGDGGVTLNEYLKTEALVENHATLTEDFHFNDHNKDGVVNMVDIRLQFNQIDTNNDDKIEQNEFVVYAENLVKTKGHPAFGK
ncbi:hypothetical protein LOTGIDRAFT_232913 [Lottia gigantea]|uniref:EF-hand domain-containing protein n=1 Tax=Lottia gigantea TaxID=225164 RepID=V4AHD3_LOTGI|nr:hypothetical protein LOTGIDRAFT_232913 [Lottia gigantea]ESO92801.1 hypothetical protein LOTGIDRAFT_232913 [Lottia gigantea]